MKEDKSFRASLLAAALLLSAAVVSPKVRAQDGAASAPQISEFYVESEDQLSVGSKLLFTVEGSAGGSASVRISGIPQRIALKEVEPGVYEGSYTVKKGDRITAATTARSTLARRNRSSSSVLKESLGLTVSTGVAAPPVALPGVLAIESLSVKPLDKLEPGADLEFTMQASPGGQAAVSIEGVASPVPLRELKAGSYAGSYTVRRNDKISANARVSGTLVAGGKTVRLPLNQALVTAAKKALVGNLSPADGEKVRVGEAVAVSATFDDSTGGGIDPKSVAVTLDGRDVTSLAVVTAQFFNLRTDLEAGAHVVAVSAKDRAGTAVRQTWKFTVEASAGPPAALPLEVTSHLTAAEVVPGPIEVRGRTVADASIEVLVVGVPSVLGVFGVRQQLLTQTIRADASGAFVFSFVAPKMPKGGGSYEISLVATKGSQRQTLNLVLVQKQK